MVTFGKTYQTLFTVKTLLCKMIDEQKAETSAPKTIRSSLNTSATSLISDKAKVMIKKKVPTTPQSILNMLKTVEKKKEAKKYKFKVR